MNDFIKADNYIYTKNIYPNHIDKFEKDLKTKKDFYENNYSYFFKIKNREDSFTKNKNKIIQIGDYLKDINPNFILVFDGKESFQLWANLDKNQLKLLTEKFNKKYLEKISKSEKIKLFKINLKKGLSSCVLNYKELKNFKVKDSRIDLIYKKELNKKFNWEKIKMGREKIIKDVQDYLKFKHNQIFEMYNADPNYKEDREGENFYRQVRKSSFEIIPKARLNQYFLGSHIIKRMDEREVSPIKLINIVEDGKQIQSDISPNKIFIKKGIFVVVLDTRAQKFLTVMKENDFASMSDIILKNMLEKNYKKYSEKEKIITFKELEKFKTVEELKNYLKITEIDYKRDEDRIKRYKSKTLAKLKNKKSSSPLMSNPPYVGDMIEYIKKRNELEKKSSVDSEDLKSAFGKYWNSKVVKTKGKLLNIPLSKTWNLNFKTLHSENLSGDSDTDSWAKEVLEIMKKPIVVLRYKYPDEDNDKYYVLDGSHRYNEANTKNEYRLNPDEDYEKIPVFLVHLEEEDKKIDPLFYEWITEKRIPNGNWS